MAELDKVRFQVIKAEAGTGRRRRLGEVDLDTDGVLTVADAVADAREYLNRLVTGINRKPLLHVGILPPAGAPAYAVCTRGIARPDPRFFDALQAFLAKHYGVFLAAGGAIDAAPFPPTELIVPGETPA